VDLGAATWPEVEETAARTLLVLPLGSLEQHGPHLPLDTDARIAAAVAEGLSRARTGIAVAPALPYGASGEHAAFPGTLLLGHDVLADVLVELVRSARSSFLGVVLVSAHGGNHDALAMAEKRCASEGDDVLAWTLTIAGSDAHAGRTETSLMLAIDPDTVRLDRAEAGCTDPLHRLMPRLREEGLRPVSPNGVLGDPSGAGAREGRELPAVLVSELADAVSARWPRP
jgi:mycofactocin precursor peptide peptidase